MERLSLDIVQERIEKLSGWSIVEDKWLQKKYRFPEFLDAISFVNEIASLSEEENHHPFISIDYVLVTLKLTSWKARGITELDLRLIEQYDERYMAYQKER